MADNLPPHNAGLRSDSPPGWLKSNLEQLTGGDSLGGRFGGLNGSGGIPALAGLGLSGGHHQQQPMGHWGQPSPVMSNTPPPGFALNRGGMGMQPPAVSQPHPFSTLAGLGGAGSAGAPGGPVDRDELARLVRS